jgi:hypothetical protein
MELLTSGGLGKVFRGSADALAYQKLFARQQEEQRLRRDRDEDLKQDEAEFLDFVMATVSADDVAEFKGEVTRYEVATVEALQKNEEQMELSRERIEALLGKAHVLPDGRRVFKTEDGQRVFDENGTELDANIIEPDAIADERPHWESYKAEKDQLNALERERTDILDYQEKLDTARERLDSGEMTRKEFDELREELKAEMPDAVRAHVPGMEANQEANADRNAEPLIEELDITDDMVPSSLSSKIPAPGLGG